MKDTRERIIQATIQLIETKGCESVNMRQLGSEINLSRSAMYNHFKNKEELLAVVVRESFYMLYQELEKLLEIQLDQKTFVKKLLLTYYKFGTTHKELYTLMFLKNWNDLQRGGVDDIAIETFLLMKQNIPIPTHAPIVMAFIHGLIELNNKGHNESKKGLNDPIALIEDFIELLFYEN